MHPRNRYRSPHDFPALAKLEPELADYLITTPDGRTSLRFGDPRAVYLLNRTLLLRDYGLTHWDLPAGHLTPPVPGRLDYIHLLHDLCPDAGRVLDIGTGASLIYPLLGRKEYGWQFVGTEVNPTSLRVAGAIIKANRLKGIELRRQQVGHILTGILRPGERVDLTMCNPPFFASRESAVAAGRAKWQKLGKRDRGLTFGGADSELHTPGGEAGFLRQYIAESKAHANQVRWFTTLVSKSGYLGAALQQLERVGAKPPSVLPLEQGNKRMRVLAWQFS